MDLPLDISKHISMFSLSLVFRHSCCWALYGAQKFHIIARKCHDLLIHSKSYLLLIFRNAYSSSPSRRHQCPFTTEIVLLAILGPMARLATIEACIVLGRHVFLVSTTICATMRKRHLLAWTKLVVACSTWRLCADETNGRATTQWRGACHRGWPAWWVAACHGRQQPSTSTAAPQGEVQACLQCQGDLRVHGDNMEELLNGLLLIDVIFVMPH